MKDATREKVEAEIKDWSYMRELPPEWFGFRLVQDMRIHGDTYDLYSYAAEERHRSITAYFHEETKEYKVRVRIGLTEFCHIEFVTGSLTEFEKLLRKHFETVLRDMAQFRPETVTNLLWEKGLREWEYGKSLPAELEGFELFICPSEPLRITNGSYILFDYSDFSIASNFIIYYNIFRDEFFGEARIGNIPVVTYIFDSSEFSGLELKLQGQMIPYLREIRQRSRDPEVK